MKLRPLFILLAALTLSATVRSAPGTLIPRPQEATRLDGQFVFTTGIPVVYASGLEPLAEYIADYIPLQRLDDRTWTAGAALRLSLDGTMDDESYRLTVTPQGVQVVGADYGGVFNGLQTLLQLLPPEVYTGQATLPLAVDACRIEDAPRFHYRGMMLDVVRTWMDADRVKRHIDLLSHLKINKLHLLLSNDEGWRLEIKSHPELTEIGAWRGGDSPVMPVYGKWDEKYGGFYTQDEMRDLIRYAAVRNVEIIPELDLPGHSRNFARVHPEILCDYTPDLRPTAGYDYRSVWCASREENYRLLADILGELAALFPEEKISEEWSSYVCLSVTDTGCGMDKETMQHIFEPFFTTKKTGEGTGLGLALADQIIRTHRGRIRAESTIGRGTTFYVYLPVLEQQQEREQLQWGVDSKLRILAADDNNKVLDLLDKDLSALGLSVSTCSRRGELRQLLEQQPFDVLAIDESLMSSSGVDFCMAIRGRYPGMTRIVMTNAPTREIVDARSHGVIDGYVVKPVSASTLLAQIRSSRKE